ncbi:hypothetical protein PT974_03293 [Cladobotryum mycophilum]|uniref:Meiotic recombination protein DMC1 n=1 Tax=Cladobotryum mycophilum TaxID=491253 RepID=A0ABR0ST00_9HYPO
MTDSPREPGGFIPTQGGLPSPAPSSIASRAHASLPQPRTRSLAAGSSKEDMVRRFVEEKLLFVSRRYVKKFGNPNPGDAVVGFRSFSEVCRELDSVVNVLWKSGTPSLQVPFLLKLASDFTQYVRSFPPAPKSTFDLLRKLDHCFASLLRGQDVETNETLPGFENGLRAGMTTTDMVRCRSLVEQTRFLMVEVMSMGEMEEEEEEEETEEETEDDQDDFNSTTPRQTSAYLGDEEDGEIHLDAARVYQNTIVQLNSKLGDTLDQIREEPPIQVCMSDV